MGGAPDNSRGSVPAQDPQARADNRDREVAVAIGSHGCCCPGRQSLHRASGRQLAGAAAPDGQDRDSRVRRVDEWGDVARHARADRQDHHVGCDGARGVDQRDLARRTDIARHQHHDPVRRHGKHPALTCVRDHPPPDAAGNMVLAGRRVRDVYRGGGRPSANTRFAGRARRNVERADNSSVQHARKATDRRRGATGQHDPWQPADAEGEQTGIGRGRRRAGVDEHRGLRVDAHSDRLACTHVARRNQPIGLRPSPGRAFGDH
ncbi:MAG: hypothetical protein QOC73_551 [Actinomycetota bacterium]|nr:hypothetical protein [Actinomycetota bacterium]